RVDLSHTSPSKSVVELVLPKHNGQTMSKFMLSLRPDSMRIVLLEAQTRGISVQELIRAVIIPDWVRENVRKEDRTVLEDVDQSGTVTPAELYRIRR
ncbi:MAG TPA: hypothetical protein VE177_03585, partial [Candidatus Binatus sp.]|nr:hypothetical protein [Candidatus Binatus sp.]